MDEVENLLISVLLPIGSIRPWLSDCLESIERASSNLDVELVVVLNNLQEGEQKLVAILVKKIVKKNYKILLSDKNNLGDILNDGILSAKGRYIARIDDDDLMEPDRLSIQAKFLEQNPKTVLVGGSTKVIDESGLQIRLNKYPRSDNHIRQLLKYGNCFAHSVVMFSRQDAVNVGMYQKDYLYAEDYQLWTKLAEIGEVHNVELPVGSYRLHKCQLNITKKEAQLFSVKKIIREIAQTDLHKIFVTKGQVISVKKKFQFRNIAINSRILSRQYFAMARLFADDMRRLNQKSIGCLLFSLFINPLEFLRIINAVLPIRNHTRISN